MKHRNKSLASKNEASTSNNLSSIISPENSAYMVLSDIHGNTKYLKRALKIFEDNRLKHLYVLGDIGYDAIVLLNDYAERITAVRGNCDSSYEIEEASFPLPWFTFSYAFDKQILLMHGDKPQFDNLCQLSDIVLTGHTHVAKIYKDPRQGKIYANPGSLSLPRDGHHSYLLLTKDGIRIFDIDTSKLLMSLNF